MKKVISRQVRTLDGGTPRVLKLGNEASILPTPAAVRRRGKLEQWRDRLWRSQHKFMVLPGPQYRELAMKIAFSMDKAGLHGMVVLFRSSLFCIWFLTGSVQKMEEFILAIFNGKVFLMNSRLLLLYDPHCYRDGCSLELTLQATPFLTFLGNPPEAKPWIAEWASEMKEAQRQAAADIGKESADALWAEVTEIKTPGKRDRDARDKSRKEKEKTSYW